MIRKSLLDLALSNAFAIPAFAQSSVTLYGMIDEGLTYVSNAAGHSQWAAAKRRRGRRAALRVRF